MGLPDRVIDIDVGDLIGAGQQRRRLRQGEQQPGGDRVQLPDMAEGHRPQERAQRRRRPQPVEEPAHPAVAQQIQVTDRVRAGDHPRDQSRDLDCGVRSGRAGNRDVLGDQLVQPGALGQRHHRGQTGDRDQVRVIENCGELMGDSHLPDALVCQPM